jgi:hypothetical protein
MNTVKTAAVCLTLLTALNAAAQDGKQEMDRKVFGGERRSIGTPAAKAPAEKKADNTAPKTGYKRKPSEQEAARQLYERFTHGDNLYAAKLRDAANGGNRWASLYYGYLAETGKLSGRQDMQLALRSYQKAVKNPDGSLTGNHLAAYNLGLAYYYGKGVAPDSRSALKWLLTAIQAYRESKGRNAVFWPAEYHAGLIKEAAAKTAPTQLVEARSHYANAARMRDPNALYRYGLLIAAENQPAALPYYNRAADRWHSGAMVALARYYSKGDSLHKANRLEAVRWLQIAAATDKRYASYAKRAMNSLKPDEQNRVGSSVTMWLQRRGIRPAPFDYAAPLFEDPATIR